MNLELSKAAELRSYLKARAAASEASLRSWATEHDELQALAVEMKASPPKVTIEIVVRSADGKTVHREAVEEAVPVTDAAGHLTRLHHNAVSSSLIAGHSRRQAENVALRDGLRRSIQRERERFYKEKIKLENAILKADEREKYEAAKRVTTAPHKVPSTLMERLGLEPVE